MNVTKVGNFCTIQRPQFYKGISLIREMCLTEPRSFYQEQSISGIFDVFVTF